MNAKATFPTVSPAVQKQFAYLASRISSTSPTASASLVPTTV